MTPLVVPASVAARLDWTYGGEAPRVRGLYDQAERASWSAGDLDWATPVPFGEPLPADSPAGLAAFAASPLAARGPDAWTAFRWEFQGWMVSQFLHGEQGALVAAARVLELVPGTDAKLAAASQVADEARHVDVFARYLAEKTPHPYPITATLRALIGDVLADSRWDVTALGMQVIVEALAMAAFRMAGQTFHDPLIRRITALVARDEARHVTFGVLALRPVYEALGSAELAEREELVLESASLMRRRFLLGDVWERLDVPAADGARFAERDPLMARYRTAVFAKVVAALRGVGLLTDRVRSGLDGLGLLGVVGRG
ncbi:ferritin-like domain-containing protein [Actinosynnema sp. NPDC020468]|uniref:ferritin-like domain-containing protein n=1 Tax=Actinosynnema sp. NPDC020468 TaxID=3154488 RepID=UPI00340E080C